MIGIRVEVRVRVRWVCYEIRDAARIRVEARVWILRATQEGRATVVESSLLL